MITANKNRNAVVRWTIVAVLFAVVIFQTRSMDRELADAHKKIESLTANQSHLLALVSAADKRASDEMKSLSSPSRAVEEIANLDDLTRAMNLLEERKRALEAEAKNAKAVE